MRAKKIRSALWQALNHPLQTGTGCGKLFRSFHSNNPKDPKRFGRWGLQPHPHPSQLKLMWRCKPKDLGGPQVAHPNPTTLVGRNIDTLYGMIWLWQKHPLNIGEWAFISVLEVSLFFVGSRILRHAQISRSWLIDSRFRVWGFLKMRHPQVMRFKTWSGWWLSHSSEKYEFVSWDDYSQSMEKLNMFLTTNQ